MKKGFEAGTGKNREAGQSLSAAKASHQPLPEWVEVLAKRCDETSQNAVAKELGYSAAVISASLKNSYKGDLSRVEQRVKGALMRADVACPVMGGITGGQCTRYQQRMSSGASSIFIRLKTTCPTCPHNMGGNRQSATSSPHAPDNMGGAISADAMPPLNPPRHREVDNAR